MTDALNIIAKQGKISILNSLKGAFERIYVYTSSSDGIRHALSNEANVEHEDSRFMLISYDHKAEKSNIVLE